MTMTLTVDGTSASINATSGHDKWAWGMFYDSGSHRSFRQMANLMNDLAYIVCPSGQDNHFVNIKNLTMGCPSLPAGVTPEPY